MSAWLPYTVWSTGPEPEHTSFVDPVRELDVVRRRWEVRSAQWRAAAIAESIFGGPVGVTLRGASGGGAFRGLLRLEVGFDDLELHRWRERVFNACAARDPVLSRVPLVYVFTPRAASVAEGAP